MMARNIYFTALIGAIVALLAAGCAAPRPATKSESLAEMTSVGRVVVAPLNLGLRVAPDLKVDGNKVWQELVVHFQQLDRVVEGIDADGARQVWNESFAELGRSGSTPDLASVSQRFAQGLAGHAEYDLLVMPSLLLRSARVRGGVAYWDGVRRKVPTHSTPPVGVIDLVGQTSLRGAIRATQWSLEGRVAAVSLHVSVLSSDGRMLYQGIGGLDVLQEAQRSGSSGAWELVERTDTFSKSRSVSRGIEVAFERRLPKIAAAW